MAHPKPSNDPLSPFNLMDSLRYGYDNYTFSRAESDEMWNLYNGRQYDYQVKNELTTRGQPHEYHNIIRLYTRMILGYLDTTINTVQIRGLRQQDTPVAALLTDVVAEIFRENNLPKIEGQNFKKSLLLDGLACMEIIPKQTEEQDEFGRPIYKVEMYNVPVNEIVIDPMSKKADYSDARFIHRFKWMSEEAVEEMFGEKTREELQSTSQYNHIGVREADYSYKHFLYQHQAYKQHRVHQIVHSVVKHKDKYWSIYWSGQTTLKKDEITNRIHKFPYVVRKLEDTDKVEYYGIFRDVKETQKAINQAVIKLQLMANSQRVFVDNNGLEENDMANFTAVVNSVNAVVRVNDLAGIKVENMTREVLEQYSIIDKALERVQKVLHINDSFLGQAAASDSGRKVNIQKGATILSLQYIQNPLEAAWQCFGETVVSYIQQYYTAHQAFQISDDIDDQRFLELNQPIIDPETGTYVYELVVDPNTGKPMRDEAGDMLFSPLPMINTEPQGKKFKIQIEASSHENQDENNQLMLESILNGPSGQLLANVAPVEHLEALAIVVGNMKTKASLPVKRILERLAQRLKVPSENAAAAYLSQQSTPHKDGASRTGQLAGVRGPAQNPNPVNV